MRRLISSELAALPALRRALDSKDAELSRRARKCIEQIEQATRYNLPLVAIRLLTKRRPAGAAEALLNYLPTTTDEEVEEEIYYGLDTLAVEAEERLRPLLLAALKDAQPARRAVAGCIIGRIGDAEQRTAAKKLLADPSPLVRLRTAQGLLAGKDTAAIRPLIELLDESSVEIAWQAEELLRYAVGPRAPTIIVGRGSVEERRACRKAWEKWWGDQGAKLDLRDYSERKASN